MCSSSTDSKIQVSIYRAQRPLVLRGISTQGKNQTDTPILGPLKPSQLENLTCSPCGFYVLSTEKSFRAEVRNKRGSFHLSHIQPEAS